MRNREEILHTINIALATGITMLYVPVDYRVLYRNVLIVFLVLNTINIIKGDN